MHLDKHALILGASGISGWALLNQARKYPSETTFSRITGTTNRPLTLEEALIPADERIQLVNGIDFTTDVDEVKSLLQEKIPDISTVTHIFFTAYIQKADFQSLKDVNNTLLETSMKALASICPDLECVILQTGGKAYGVEFPNDLTLQPPFKESTPRIPKPHCDDIFYYTQHDLLASLSASASWSFNEVRPDVIIGFVPNDNAMDCARGIALYLSLWALVHGFGSTVPFPGTDRSWTCLHTDTSQDVLARFEIFAALKPETCGKGEAFNIADTSEPVTWEAKWPRLCGYFGLKGAGPLEAGDEKEMNSYNVFVEQHKAKWAQMVREKGLKTDALEAYQWGFMDGVTVKFDFDRQYHLGKARGIGFAEEVDTVEGYFMAFDRLREARFIPTSADMV